MDPPFINPNAAGYSSYNYNQQQQQTSGELRSRAGGPHVPRPAPSMPVQNNFDDFFNSMVNTGPPPTTATVPAVNASAAPSSRSAHAMHTTLATTASNFYGSSAIDMGFDAPAFQQQRNDAILSGTTAAASSRQLPNSSADYMTQPPFSSSAFAGNMQYPTSTAGQRPPNAYNFQQSFSPPQQSGGMPYADDFSGNMSFAPVAQPYTPVQHATQQIPSLSAAAAGLTAEFLGQPAAGMAMAYGQTFLSQGTDMMSKKFETLADVTGLNKIRFYFAVDNAYVAKKLGLLLFPFARRDWSLKYSQQQSPDGQQRNLPVAPRYDVNCPDLYIPSMAIATFLLISGWCLGLANRFNPEQLSIQLSHSLAWLAFEVLAIMLVLYITSLKSKLSLVHVVVYSGYKYVAMSLVLLASIFIGDMGYWVATVYTGLSIAFFCIRSLRVYMLEEITMAGSGEQNLATKRRLWILLGISLFQPLMIYLLTRDLAYTGVLQSMAAALSGGKGTVTGPSGGGFMHGNILQKNIVP